MLALRHSSQLKREFNADVETYQFTAQGTRSSRGTHFTFRVTPREPKKLWRIIVGYPYLLNKKKQKSPDSRTMKATYYARTKAEVIAEKHRLRQEAIHEVKKIGKHAWIQDRTSHPLFRRVNVSIAQVDFDANLIGITTYLDD